ncbi:MAG: hypothetical protein WCF67_06460 [Chitinophagaceae bacterium]
MNNNITAKEWTKAAEDLGIPEELLVFTIDGLTSVPESTEAGILKIYGRYCIDTYFNEHHESLLASDDPIQRANAAKAIDHDLLTQLGEVERTIPGFSYDCLMVDGECLANYHIGFWAFVTGLCVDVVDRFSIPTGQCNYTGIVKLKCKYLIDRIKRIDLN